MRRETPLELLARLAIEYSQKKVEAFKACDQGCDSLCAACKASIKLSESQEQTADLPESRAG